MPRDAVTRRTWILFFRPARRLGDGLHGECQEPGSLGHVVRVSVARVKVTREPRRGNGWPGLARRKQIESCH